MSAAGSAPQGTKRKNFSLSERDELIRHLLAGSRDGALERGAYEKAAKKYKCHWETIKRVWVKYAQQRAEGIDNPDLASDRKGKCGRKGNNIEELRTRLRDIPLNERTTQRRLAAALGIPLATLKRNLTELGLKGAAAGQGTAAV